MLAGTRDAWENYGSRNPAAVLGSAVIVGPGKDTSGIIFRFFAPAAIVGRGILDEAGQPAEGVLVQLVRSRVTSGRSTADIDGYQWTNDLGEYRFGHLAGGASYYLAVSGKPWYTQQGQANGGPGAAYATDYYPGTNDPSKAAPVLPKPGQEVRAPTFN